MKKQWTKWPSSHPIDTWVSFKTIPPRKPFLPPSPRCPRQALPKPLRLCLRMLFRLFFFFHYKHMWFKNLLQDIPYPVAVGGILRMHTLWSVFAAWEVLFPAGSCVTLAWPASPPWVAQALWLFCIPHHDSFSTSPHSADFPFLLLFSKQHQHNAENVWQAFGCNDAGLDHRHSRKIIKSEYCITII